MCNDGIMMQHVIAINPRGEKARTHSQATINGCALPTVRFARPVGQPRSILFDDLDGVISTSAIEYYVLQIWIPLEQNRANCLFNEPPLIKGGGHHGYARPWT